MTASLSDRRRPWAGIAVAVACGVTLGTLLTRAHPNGETAYLPGVWIELIGLAICGTIFLLRTDHRVRWIAGSIGFLLAAQLAGSAVYAFKRWEPIGGFGGGVSNLVLVRILAVSMATAAVIAATSCAVVLIRDGVLRISLSRSSRIGVAIGVALGIGLPWVLGVGGPATTDLTSIGAYAVLFSVPYGLTLVGVAWLKRVPASAVLLTVAASAALLILPLRPNVVEIRNHRAGFLTVAVAACLTAITQRHQDDTEFVQGSSDH